MADGEVHVFDQAVVVAGDVNVNLGQGFYLAAGETGFSWYPSMSKLSHELMNLRHLQGHVGQLSELLMAHGIDTDWVARSGGSRE